MAGRYNRDNERQSLSGVKAVARRDRLVGKRLRASRVLDVARGKRDYKGTPKCSPVRGWQSEGLIVLMMARTT